MREAVPPFFSADCVKRESNWKTRCDRIWGLFSMYHCVPSFRLKFFFVPVKWPDVKWVFPFPSFSIKGRIGGERGALADGFNRRRKKYLSLAGDGCIFVCTFYQRWYFLGTFSFFFIPREIVSFPLMGFEFSFAANTFFFAVDLGQKILSLLFHSFDVK